MKKALDLKPEGLNLITTFIITENNPFCNYSCCINDDFMQNRFRYYINSGQRFARNRKFLSFSAASLTLIFYHGT